VSKFALTQPKSLFMRVYFDNAATTPLSETVLEVMLDCMKHHFGNPSAIHAEGRIARAAIELARKTVAKCLHASVGEIFFTSGGTESNNMVLKNTVRDLGVQRIISSPLEHHCVGHTLEALQKNQNTLVEYVRVNEKGQVDLAHLKELLVQKAGKTLVSLMHANNEIGTMLDLDEVAALCHQHNALFHSDTVQTVGHFPINVSKTKIHFLAGAAHKFHGPKGIGFVYINSDHMIKPYIDGGSQERNMRGGTENVYGIVGMAKALELYLNNLDSIKNKILLLRNQLKNKILDHFEDIQLNGDVDGKSLYTVLSVSFPPSRKSELLLFNLDMAGISASGGSACSSGVEGGSHVLTAINADPDRKTIRFSLSHYNTEAEVDYVIEKLKNMVVAKKIFK
jgi:cysteine desulfurase